MKQRIHDKDGFQYKDVEIEKQRANLELRQQLTRMALEEGIYAEDLDITIHRTYTDGDGWMTGYELVYFVVEVNGTLHKIFNDFADREGRSNMEWGYKLSAGSTRLDLAKDEIFNQ